LPLCPGLNCRPGLDFPFSNFAMPYLITSSNSAASELS
jgi:hypothetical protein